MAGDHYERGADEACATTSEDRALRQGELEPDLRAVAVRGAPQ
jgi:hypothetical protein